MLPPQRPDDPGGQVAPAGDPQVRDVVLGTDVRVLPVRDPDAVQVRLALEEALLALSLRRGRDEALDQVLGTLVERAERRAVRVAGDPAVVGIRRLAR